MEFSVLAAVVAVRRGFGTSSGSNSARDARTLATDVISVLDSLGVSHATLVGHSFAGSELSYLGANFPNRVARLVYLDASYDFARLYADTVWQHAFLIPKPAAPTTGNIVDWRHWFSQVIGPGLLDDEIHTL